MAAFVDNGTGVVTVNGYEAANRALKVQEITAFVWEGLTNAERRNPELPWKTSELGAEWWTAVSVRTGHNARVSEETRSQVALALCRLVNAERRFTTEPCEYEHCHEGSVSTRTWGTGDAFMDGEGPHEECKGTGFRLCADCGERPGSIVVPTGLFCPPCAQKTFASLLPREGAGARTRVRAPASR